MRERRRPVGSVLAMAVLSGLGFAAAGPAALSVEELRLENGMTFLLVDRPGREMTAAAWAVRAGSGLEKPGSTGVAHLLEHLLFGGTRIIGTRDWPAEVRLMEQRDQLQREVDSVGGGAGSSRSALNRRLANLDRRLSEIRIEGEYARHYAEAGAVGLEAQTNKDMSLYSVLVPRSRLELWFWLESDRLLHPVFRGLHGEMEVVAQERRERLESSALGVALERFDRKFWGEGHPYSWSTDGLPGDLRRLSRADVREHFAATYIGPNLIAVLVGDFDSTRVKQLARRYFGRIPGAPELAGSAASDQEETVEGSQRLATESSDAKPPIGLTHSCRCRPQAELRYSTVPFGHPDAVILDVIAALLSGRTGRLHHTLVMEKRVAFSASTRHSAYRLGGYFSVFATGQGQSAASALAGELAAEVARLRQEEVSAQELERALNRLRIDAARETKEPLALALRLLAYESLGGWRRIEIDGQIAGLVPADVQRVAERYLVPDRQSSFLIEADGERR